MIKSSLRRKQTFYTQPMTYLMDRILKFFFSNIKKTYQMRSLGMIKYTIHIKIKNLKNIIMKINDFGI